MNFDDEHVSTRPVEETPGYVGHIFIDFLIFQDELSVFDSFDFGQYAVLAEENGTDEREMAVDFGNGVEVLHFRASCPHEIVGSVPSVEVIYDSPPDQGPGSEGGYVFVLRDSFQLDQIAIHAKVLKSALDEDLQDLAAITPG